MAGKFNFALLLMTVLMLLVSGCELPEVENPNDPDSGDVFSRSQNVRTRTDSLLNSWFMTVHAFEGMALPLLTAADAGTSPNGYGYPYSKEPRIEYNNHPSFSFALHNEKYYNSLYITLSEANDILSILKNQELDFSADETAMTEAMARFVQGVCLGYLGLVYDKAFIVTDETELSKMPGTPSPWREVINTAVSSLEKAAEVCSNSNFTIPSKWLPGEQWNSGEFKRLANSFAARMIVYSSRNKTDDIAANWEKVYEYASDGIEKDFAPLADDDTWYSSYHSYANYLSYTATDMYVVNMMDPAMPSRWVDENTWDILPEPVTTHKDGVDDRIFTDFQYLNSCSFRPDRGYYLFSCYRCKRFDQYLQTETEPMPEFRKVENDYLLAEAAARTGKLQEAADIINSSPRVTRGGLPPVPVEMDSIMEAIHHERMVELMNTGFGIQFFQMRKENKLQPGSPLHYPIPGSQLEIMNMDYYTFGGETGMPGTDFSTGGW